MTEKESQLRQELRNLEKKLQDPLVFSTKEYPKLAKRQRYLDQTIILFDKISELNIHLKEAQALAENKDPDIATMATEEIEQLNQKLSSTSSDLSTLLTPSDPNNDRDVIVEIRAAGGDESSLFAGELYRMYARWCETHGFKIELISESPSEAGGFKEIIFNVRGDEAYKNLKFEAGVHRVQRVPVTESQGRVHTSTVTVSVLPEAEETDVEINPSDLRVDVYRSSDHGDKV